RRPGRGGGRRLVLLDVAHRQPQRVPEAVDIEAVEADLLLGRHRCVVLTQPLHEREHLSVGPHPGWPATEDLERSLRVRCGALAAADEAIDLIAVRPITLDRDRGEATLLD